MAIFLVSAGVLIFEVSLTRLFSVVMFYHFAFMAISLAMFGLGVSGLLVLRLRGRLNSKSFASLTGTACLLAALGVLVDLTVIVRVPIDLAYSGANVARLVMIYVLAAIPFFAAGVVIAAILFVRSADVSRLYFWDLTGAAMGAIAAVVLLNQFGAPGASLLAGAMFAAGAILLFEGLALRMAATVLSIVFAAIPFTDLTTRVFDLQFLKGRAKAHIEFEKWNAFSYVTVQRHPNQPDAAIIEIDADAATYILRNPIAEIGAEGIRDQVAVHWASSIPYSVADSGAVLIIGPGGGLDVVFALAWGAEKIDAVELNPLIANDVMSKKYREFSGNIYDWPEVNLQVAEGRSYIRRTDTRYDLIQLTLVDTWAASAAGAFSLAENHLYTVEAFEDYIQHLGENSVLGVTRWIFPEPRETLRLMTTVFEAAERSGITNPAAHIAIAAVPMAGSKLELAAFMFKKSAFSPDEIDVIARRAQAGGGRVVFSPFASGNTSLHEFAYSPDREKFLADYDYNVSPATDDCPFFFNLIRPGQLKSLFALESEVRKSNLGILNLAIAAAVSTILLVLFLLGPLVAMRKSRLLRDTPGGARMLGFFTLIGFGFILIEVSLMQQFVLYLGHPVYAMSVVLSCLLVSAGLGALYTQRMGPSSRSRQSLTFALIVGTGIAELLLTPYLFESTLRFQLEARVLISILVLAPMGFFLGQPFPLGIKRVDASGHDLIPWAWGLNGAASVFGSVAAICIAMVYGYAAVLWVALACYMLAWACLLPNKTRDPAALRTGT